MYNRHQLKKTNEKAPGRLLMVEVGFQKLSYLKALKEGKKPCGEAHRTAPSVEICWLIDTNEQNNALEI